MGGVWHVVDQIGGPQYALPLNENDVLYYVSDSTYLSGYFLRLDVRPGPIEYEEDVIVPFQIDFYSEDNSSEDLSTEDTDDWDSEYEDNEPT